MNPSRLFAGYASLEAWAEVIDPTQPIYATKVAESGGNDAAGPVVYELCVMVAQPDEQGIVHYCRIPAATMTMLYGRPFGDEAKLRQRCHADVWRFVRNWLIERSLIIRQATFAMPRDFRLFHGRANFIRFDEATQRYQRTDQFLSETVPDVPANGSAAADTAPTEQVVHASSEPSPVPPIPPVP